VEGGVRVADRGALTTEALGGAATTRRWFGTDGVRGIVGEALTEGLVEQIGRAATLWSGRGRVLVGRDTRESGPRLEAALRRGIVDAGGTAVLAGVLPTPAVALLSQDLGHKIFYYYYKYINKNSRLLLVGSSNGFEKYYNELLELIKILDLKNVVITGKVSFNDLVSYYRCADLFLCVSEHEGFCVPIVESMIFHVPIIAYNSTAIPSTLGKSGILFNDKHKYIEIAEMIDIVLNDKTLEGKIISKQDERLNEFSEKSVEDRFKLIIARLTNKT
jgi:hypothetical protein